MRELQKLFTVVLAYKKGIPKVLDGPGRTGEYLGSGEGSLVSEDINGQVRWDLFEKVDETIH